MSTIEKDRPGSNPEELPVGNPRVSPGEEGLPAWTLPTVIIISVVVFNLHQLLPDLLWHDDGAWYFQGTKGFPFPKEEWREKTCTLAPYLDAFYSYGMVYLGLPLIRGIFTVVMALSSVSIFLFYRNSLGIASVAALPAALLPNILPSLMGIPVGLNTSYAMWGLLPITISLLLLTLTFNYEGIRAWLTAGGAFGCYYLGLNLPGLPAANFLIPCVLYYLLMFFPSQRRKALSLGFPFLGLGLWQLYKQYLFSHKIPVSVPLEEMLSRTRHFLEMSDFLAFDSPLSVWLTLGLILSGMLGLLLAGSAIFKKPRHFDYNPGFYRALLIGWPLVWMVSNSLAYIAVSPECRTYDYAYVFNFGSILLQTAGICFLASLPFVLCRRSRWRNLTVGILFALIIPFTGYQRIQHRYDGWSPMGKLEISQTSKLIRDTLSGINVPPRAQILILDAEAIHPGNYRVNSGYLRYLLSRIDVNGLIGSDVFPKDVFKKWRTWGETMQGFSWKRPTLAFRYRDGSLYRVDLLLQLTSTGRQDFPRFQWVLYDIRDAGSRPVILQSGLGLTGYFDFINHDLPSSLDGADIAFAPREHYSRIVGDTDAEGLAGSAGLLPGEIPFGDRFNRFTLRNILTEGDGENTRLQLLIRADRRREKEFRLSYVLNGDEHSLPVWDYLEVGDHILVTSPPVGEKHLARGIPLEFSNGMSWPLPKILRTDTSGGKDSTIIVKRSGEKGSGR